MVSNDAAAFSFADLMQADEPAFVWNVALARPTWANAAGCTWLGVDAVTKMAPTARSQCARTLAVHEQGVVALKPPYRARAARAACAVHALALANGSAGRIVRVLAGRALSAQQAGAEPWQRTVGRAVHEIRNPINAALGYAQLLAAPGRAPRRDYAAHIVTALHGAVALIDELAALAGGPNAQADPPPGVYALSEIAAAALMLAAPRARAGNIRLRRYLAGGRTDVAGNGQRMVQALHNLLINAIEHAAGATEVRLSVRASSGGALSAEIADNGRGRALRAVRRGLSAAPAIPADGHGHGLVTVARTVAAQGGRVEARARRGGGTSVRITVPRAQQQT